MIDDPARIRRVFGTTLDIAEVLEIEPGRFLTFEYIGPTDYFDESPGKPRVRGSRCTSADAAFRYLTSTGAVELALIEWKYTEQYLRPRVSKPGYDKIRMQRYRADYEDPSGPLRSERLSLEWMLDEPFYQLMRQQLMAWNLEKDRAEGASVVRVLHVLPPENGSYQQSLVRPEHRELGSTVDEVWGALLRRPDRFSHVDPARFLAQSITSWHYVDRYSPTRVHEMPRGVGVWRDSDDRIVAATSVHGEGFEWCGQWPLEGVPPRDFDSLVRLPNREYLGLYDDEKGFVVGSIACARAFLQALVASGLTSPTSVTNHSYPSQETVSVTVWPPHHIGAR